MSSKTVQYIKSSHSSSCKRGVHTQEIVQDKLNTSNRLNSKGNAAPILTEYVRRIKDAWYPEKYHRLVLTHTFGILNRKIGSTQKWKKTNIQAEDMGERTKKERNKNKRLNWAKKYRHIAPIFCPYHTRSGTY